jgi:large subunit ribosomal protein L25
MLHIQAHSLSFSFFDARYACGCVLIIVNICAATACYVCFVCLGQRYVTTVDGYIPGVIYGKDDDGNVLKMLVTVPVKDLMRELRSKGKSFENTLYSIIVQPTGEQYYTTPRQIQFNPVTDLPVSVNFLRYIPGNRIRIPVEYTNAEDNVELRRGSFLLKVNSFVECICGIDIPHSLQVDVSTASKGEVFRINNIKFPPHVRPAVSVPLDYVLCILKTSRRN